jgi:hypothetical protein
LTAAAAAYPRPASQARIRPAAGTPDQDQQNGTI